MTTISKINSMDSDELDDLMDRVKRAYTSFEGQYNFNIAGIRDEGQPVDKGHFQDFRETGMSLIKFTEVLLAETEVT